jgi:hypothetical protein
MALIPKAVFPNVPKLPGVPQLKRSLNFPAGVPPIINGVIALGRLALALVSKPQWGIFKIEPPEIAPPTAEGELETVVVKPPPAPVLVPDNFTRLNMEQAWEVTDAPVQEGSFASYNKVETPFEIRLRMTKGGTLASRQKFLDTLEDIAKSLDLYRILTPERSYLNVNITGYRVTRESATGAYFLAEVEITFREIRQVQAQYTSTASNTQNAKTPSAKPVDNRGTLNAIPAVGRVRTAVNNALAPLRSIAAVLGGG